jgi:hypothetical protein
MLNVVFRVFSSMNGKKVSKTLSFPNVIAEVDISMNLVLCTNTEIFTEEIIQCGVGEFDSLCPREVLIYHGCGVCVCIGAYGFQTMLSRVHIRNLK